MLLLADLQRQLNRLFEQTASIQRSSLQQSTGWQPKIDVVEHVDRFSLAVEVPGIPSHSLEVVVAGDVLLIRGSKPVALPAGVQGTFRCVERERGDFERRIRLGQPIDPRACTTVLENGLLTIRVPKLTDRRDRTHTVPIRRAKESHDD